MNRKSIFTFNKEEFWKGMNNLLGLAIVLAVVVVAGQFIPDFQRPVGEHDLQTLLIWILVALHLSK